ncbi:hypothetical protein [Paraburkholderia hospita]|uniref:hypothetical protein n=1 Tax=Paraburkholderia hospita TaxID=169430 RepID=UPI0011783154|nr:hypothetical protein [Paraburkholderia hospita]
MTEAELRVHLDDLIERYVSDELVERRLLLLVDKDEVPAKGIMVELTPFTKGRLSEQDRKVIGDIAFYFC